MPFDNVNFQPEPSPLLRLLLRARDRIKKGWIQNATVRQRNTSKGIRYSYCLLGSIGFDDKGEAFADRKSLDLSAKAIFLLSTKIREKHGRSNIPTFNDSYNTNKKMVVGVLDEVIAEQEMREVTHKVTTQ